MRGNSSNKECRCLLERVPGKKMKMLYRFRVTTTCTGFKSPWLQYQLTVWNCDPIRKQTFLFELVCGEASNDFGSEFLIHDPQLERLYHTHKKSSSSFLRIGLNRPPTVFPHISKHDDEKTWFIAWMSVFVCMWATEASGGGSDDKLSKHCATTGMKFHHDFLQTLFFVPLWRFVVRMW